MATKSKIIKIINDTVICEREYAERLADALIANDIADIREWRTAFYQSAKQVNRLNEKYAKLERKYKRLKQGETQE